MKPLTPPDLKRCQAEFPHFNAFVMGGPTTTWTRCEKPPTWIVKETKPGADGRKGSMSLCDDCKVACAARMSSIAFEPISRCDRRGCKELAVASRVCANPWCKRTYARCAKHDGEAGIARSLHSHNALAHPSKLRMKNQRF